MTIQLVVCRLDVNIPYRTSCAISANYDSLLNAFILRSDFGLEYMKTLLLCYLRSPLHY